MQKIVQSGHTEHREEMGFLVVAKDTFLTEPVEIKNPETWKSPPVVNIIRLFAENIENLEFL